MKLKTFPGPSLDLSGFDFQDQSGGEDPELNELLSEWQLEPTLSHPGAAGATFPQAAPSPEVSQLKARVAHLESLVQRLVEWREQGQTIEAKAAVVTGGSPPLVDPYQHWLTEHRAVLALYPDSFVAIDPSKGAEGVVLHARDEDEFSAQLLKRYASDPAARGKLLPLHTSLYA